MFKRILAAMMAVGMIFGCMPMGHARAAELTASGTTYYVSSLHGHAHNLSKVRKACTP